MKKKLLLMIMTLCLMMGFASTALARDIVVENHTNFSMHQLFITADYRHGWGPNLLSGHVRSGEDVVVPLDHRTSKVLFKVKVIERIHGERREYVWHDMNLHDIHRITLFYNHHTHTPTFRLHEN